ncbi:hypothetical protein HDE_02012 [Halotydeus destructor]|nr:hypothetical protein HDE_02012 [Halotydeus destructor]
MMSLFMVRRTTSLVHYLAAPMMTRRSTDVTIGTSMRKATTATSNYSPFKMAAEKQLVNCCPRRPLSTSAIRTMYETPEELKKKKRVAIACVSFLGLVTFICVVWGGYPSY